MRVSGAKAVDDVLGRGVYGAADALRLINFRRRPDAPTRSISRNTITRWIRGYDYSTDGVTRHSDPLWIPDYANADEMIELSFRDLIELRFVKSFRDVGLGLPTIRECFKRAVEAVQDQRPFSTRRFRTDGKTIFLEITHDVREGELLDLIRRQRRFIASSSRACTAWNLTQRSSPGGFLSGHRARPSSSIRRVRSVAQSSSKVASPPRFFSRRSRSRGRQKRSPSFMRFRLRRCAMPSRSSSSFRLEAADRS
jgi:hypothetical protein